MKSRHSAGEALIIDDAVYTFQDHPAAPGIPYAQSGRRGTVYRLSDGEGKYWALKVFHPKYREPRLVGQAERIGEFASLAGLGACDRQVLTSSRHVDLIREHRELAYAVLMPGIEGRTRFDFVSEGQPLRSQEALETTSSLASVLVGMEERGLAHCDLSGPNVIVTPEGQVDLVDLEEMYGPGFVQPEVLPGGSPGYAHKTAPQGLWHGKADRFAGAIVLCEILGWSDTRITEAAWGEGFFAPDELQVDCERSQLLLHVLDERWGGDVAECFERVWSSGSLLGCPTFSEWLAALPAKASEVARKSPAEEFTVRAIEPEVHGPGSGSDAQAEASELTQRALWSCPRCGQEVAASLETCPYCELGTRPPLELSYVKSGVISFDDRELFRQARRNTRPGLGWLRPLALGILGVLLLIGLFQAGQSNGLDVHLSRSGADGAVQVPPTLNASASPAYEAAGTLTDNSAQPAIETPTLVPTATVPRITALNVTEITRLRSFQIPQSVTSLQPAPDGSMIALTFDDRPTVGILDVQNGELVRELSNHTADITSLAWSPDARLLASAALDGSVHVWGARDGASTSVLSGHSEGVDEVVFSPNGGLLASIAGPELALWRPDDGEIVTNFPDRTSRRPAYKYPWAPHVLEFTPDGNTLLAPGGQLAEIYNTRNGKKVASLEAIDYAGNFITSADISRGGLLAAAGSVLWGTWVWQVDDGQLLFRLGQKDGRLWFVNFSPDGSLLSSASRTDGMNIDAIRIWNLENGQLIHELGDGSRETQGGMFSPDGSLLVGLTVDVRGVGIVGVWNVVTGQLEEVLARVNCGVEYRNRLCPFFVAFSTDGSKITTADFAGEVIVWGFE